MWSCTDLCRCKIGVCGKTHTHARTHARTHTHTHTHKNKPLCTHERCAQGSWTPDSSPHARFCAAGTWWWPPLLLRSLAALAWARVGSCRAAELRILLPLGYFIRESFGIVGGGLPVTSRLHWTIILFWGGLPCLHSLAQFW